eukprot:SAG11_NODE_872_length_6802_cov_8.951514_14_plen_81_part_00
MRGSNAVAQELRDALLLSSFHEGLVALCGNVGLWIGSFSGGIFADVHGPRLVMLGESKRPFFSISVDRIRLIGPFVQRSP